MLGELTRMAYINMAYISRVHIEENETSFHASWTSGGFTILCLHHTIFPHNCHSGI